MGAGLDSVVQAGIHVAAGAMSSAINAGIAGGSVLQSAVIGGFSAGVAKYAMIKIVPNACFCKQVGELAGEWGQFGMEGAVAVGTGTVMGGFSSKMMGGSFGQGARLGAWTSAHGFLFNRGAHKMLFPSIRDWIRRNVTPSDMIDAMLSQVSSWPTNATPIAFLSNILWAS